MVGAGRSRSLKNRFVGGFENSVSDRKVNSFSNRDKNISCIIGEDKYRRMK